MRLREKARCRAERPRAFIYIYGDYLGAISPLVRRASEGCTDTPKAKAKRTIVFGFMFACFPFFAAGRHELDKGGGTLTCAGCIFNGVANVRQAKLLRRRDLPKVYRSFIAFDFLVQRSI